MDVGPTLPKENDPTLYLDDVHLGDRYRGFVPVSSSCSGFKAPTRDAGNLRHEAGQAGHRRKVRLVPAIYQARSWGMTGPRGSPWNAPHTSLRSSIFPIVPSNHAPTGVAPSMSKYSTGAGSVAELEFVPPAPSAEYPPSPTEPLIRSDRTPRRRAISNLYTWRQAGGISRLNRRHV
jgi:hypothetical protein